ncbi:hypothetical protein ACHAXR_008336 [Thalassiosira sp. AJA248-18]
MLINLPEDAWRSIAIHLPPPDVLTILSVHRSIKEHLSRSASFWEMLLARDRGEFDAATAVGKSDVSNFEEARQDFMLQSYKSHLPCVKWLPLNCPRFPLSPREGHIACTLDGPENYKWIVMTGGFGSMGTIDNDAVVVINVPPSEGLGRQSHQRVWGWDQLRPRRHATSVYGASLTALPAVGSGSDKVHILGRAVRFGGFRSGGYSNEINEVWVLTIRDEEHDDGMLSTEASWEKIETSGTPPKPRAYHSATLIHGRYLVVIGGMTPLGSCMDESVLDTHTWEWVADALACRGEPNGRHGHSVVWDNKRDRLVMFGGGSGTDLLRSGVDNNEVWELKMKGITAPVPLVYEKMWEWSKLHGDATSAEDSDSDEDSDDEMGDNDSDETVDNTGERDTAGLSPVESLCLGRCHNGLKIAPDTVLLMFGGRTNTNGILAYDLRKDIFLRPKVLGPLPLPRHSGVASLLDAAGYIFVHGGYSTDVSGGNIQDMQLLDLAPSLKREFTALPVDSNRRSNRAITDEEAQQGSRFVSRGWGGGGDGNTLVQYLMAMVDRDRERA